MAQTTAERENSTEKRGRGRPRRANGRAVEPDEPITHTDDEPAETDPAAEAAAAEEAARDTSNDDVFAHMRSFPKEAWDERILAYLYRVGPITDRTRDGGYKYLMKFSKPFDSDEIMRAGYGGSGAYRVDLCSFDPITRKTTRLRQAYFQIFNYDYPPCVPPGQWMDDERNKEWEWAKPMVLARYNAKVNMNGMQGMGLEGAADLIKTVVELVDKRVPQASEDEKNRLVDRVFTELDRSRDMAASKPGEMMNVVNAIVGALTKQSGGAGDPVLLTMLNNMQAQLTAEREANRDLLKQLIERPDPGARLVETIELLDTIRGKRGGASRENSGSEWVGLARELGGKVLDVAGGVFQFILARNFPGMAQPAHPGQTPGAPGAHAAAEPQPAQLSQDQREQMISAINTQLGPLFDHVTPFLVDTFSKNLTGMDFREWFIDTHGTHTYSSAIRQMDPETIFQVIRRRAGDETVEQEIRAKLRQLVPDEKLRAFIADFMSDKPVPGEEDFEGDNPAPPFDAAAGNASRAPGHF